MNKMLEDIKRISLLENKAVLERVLKLNEEVGEFATEIGKMIGFTHKPYDEEHLIEEGAWTILLCSRPYHKWGFYVNNHKWRPLRYFSKFGVIQDEKYQ